MKHNSFNPLFEDQYASRIMKESELRDDAMETNDQEPSSDCKASNRPSFRTLENNRQVNNKTTT